MFYEGTIFHFFVILEQGGTQKQKMSPAHHHFLRNDV